MKYRDSGKGRCLERQIWGDRRRVLGLKYLKRMDKAMFHMIKTERDR